MVELKQDFDRNVNLVVVNLRDNDDEDKKFVKVFAEYLTTKLQSHIINHLKVHQSKKNAASQNSKTISVDRISYRYKAGLLKQGEDDDENLRKSQDEIMADMIAAEKIRNDFMAFTYKYNEWFNLQWLIFKENSIR
jgi:hypothetical protein